MPRVESADEATRIAVDFLKQHYRFVFPHVAKREDSRWIVYVDIAIFGPKFGRVVIEAETGKIVDFKVVDVVN